MSSVADMVHEMVAVVVLLIAMVATLLCIARHCFAQSTSMSAYRTTATSDRRRDTSAWHCRAPVRNTWCSRRGSAATSGVPRYEQPIARARSPCRAEETCRCPREPASHRCITSEGQLLIIRPSPKFNRPRDIAAARLPGATDGWMARRMECDAADDPASARVRRRKPSRHCDEVRQGDHSRGLRRKRKVSAPRHCGGAVSRRDMGGG